MAASFVEFLGLDERLQGLSYPDWQERWVQWALSANPVYDGQPQEPLFTYGGLEHDYRAVSRKSADNQFININACIQGEQDKSISIYPDTPIIINAIGAFYFIGDPYDGYELQDSGACLAACLQDVRATQNLYCQIKKVDGGWQDCRTHLLQSRFFSVDVSSRNPFLEKLETPLDPGIHHGYTVNHSCIIKKLQEGEYLLRFGARGRGSYASNGLYHLIVTKPAMAMTVPPKQVIFPTPKGIKIISPISGEEIILDK